MQKVKTWKPDKPVSTGATAYHHAVVNTKWHIINIQELVHIIKPIIKQHDIIVDFGAGTGASAVYFLREIKKKYELWLVDNSPSWLGKAYEILGKNRRTKHFLLSRTEKGYGTLVDIIGKEKVNHVVSANTFHLVPDIYAVFSDIYQALKPSGIFVFQSGNIQRKGREKGLLMIDDTVKRIHDIAIHIIKTNKRFASYRTGLEKRMKEEQQQRKIVFPDTRSIEFYLAALQSAGFENEKVTYKQIKVSYKDWLNFLQVKRLQAGILPEVGGKKPTPKEDQDRYVLINLSAKILFKELRDKNPFANARGFTAEWVYVTAKK